MFIGEYHSTLDAKGRVIVPSRIRDMVPREQESLGVYLVRGPGRYLHLYTATRWEEIVEKMPKKAYSDAEYRNFVRLLLSSASKEMWDRQGRIHIPEKLRNLAGIQKNLVFVGANDKVEIWDAEAWATFEKEKGTDFDRIASELSDQLF
ncbi:MAG: division/cell wall cluster transcriptional repressor MraZ [Planctomycetota bacterium]|nr:division/cell wall cluster transcriptional repressor MraZ [Planctomycetota bacterium]